MERIIQLHERLQVTITGVLVALLLWGLLLAALGRVGRGYLAGLWVAELLLAAQVLLGVLIVLGGVPLGPLALHVIYGVVAALVIPAVAAYVGERDGRREALILAGTCLFLLGMVGRAFETAG
jgi:heme A synthase